MGMGFSTGMGAGTVINPHGSVWILWRCANGCEIKRKRIEHIEHAINVVVAV